MDPTATSISRRAGSMFLALGIASSASAQRVVTPILMSGDGPPGLPSGLTVQTTFSSPLVGRDGTLVLPIVLQGPDLNSNSRCVLYVGHRGDLQYVARGDDQAPGLPPGFRFGDSSGAEPFGSIHAQPSNALGFFARVRDPANPTGRVDTAWIFQNGQLVAPLWAGAPAPDLPVGLSIATVGDLVLSQSGVVVVAGGLSGPGVNNSNNVAIWSGTTGGLLRFLRTGDQAPGLPAGAVIQAFRGYFSVNDAGAIVESAVTTGVLSTIGIWAGPPGAPHVVVAQGDPAPGFPTGTTLNSPAQPAISSNGDVLFSAYTSQAQNWECLFVSGTAGTRLLVQRGQQVPGYAPGNTFLNMQSEPGGGAGARPFRFNNAGQVIFFGYLLGPAFPGGSYALVRAENGSQTLIARVGGQAPGLPPGSTFGQFFDAALNNRGQVAFMAQAGSSNMDLWVFDGYQTRRLIAVGDTVQTAPGILRTVSYISFLGGSPATVAGTGLCDDGTVVLTLAFTDQTLGVFTISIGAPCYANCDASSTPPTLNVNDFLCFQMRFAAGESYANCDGSTSSPVLNMNDFMCFIDRFSSGCS